jgi:uncharacterized phiE125 gp8 family phage protein
MYNLTLKTPPTSEPLTLSEVKDFLKISDYADTCNGLSIEESILIATRTPGTVNGSYVDVLGYVATVEVNAGTVAATGKLNIKIQESNDHSTWVDWYSFDQITASNHQQTFKYTYTGDNRYIRVVAVLQTANADYAVNVILNQGYTSEDTYLSSLITAARQFCEDYQNRAYITQTWEMAIDEFPYDDDVIEIPKGKLQSIDSITYKDSDGVTTTLTADTDYVSSARGILGKVVPSYGKTWPVFTPFPLDAVIITFTCGYGNAAAVPEKVIQAMKLLISHWFTNRTPIDQTRSNAIEMNFMLSALLWQDRIVKL